MNTNLFTLSELISALVISLLVWFIIWFIQKSFKFNIKAWVLPIFLLIGMFLRPFIDDYFKPDLEDREKISFKTFENVTVELDGKEYNHCKFIDTRLVFRGTKGFALTGNNFSGFANIRFEDGAATTISTLKLLYNEKDPMFKSIIKDFLNNIISPDEITIINHHGNNESNNTRLP